MDSLPLNLSIGPTALGANATVHVEQLTLGIHAIEVRILGMNHTDVFRSRFHIRNMSLPNVITDPSLHESAYLISEDLLSLNHHAQGATAFRAKSADENQWSSWKPVIHTSSSWRSKPGVTTVVQYHAGDGTNHLVAGCRKQNKHFCVPSFYASMAVQSTGEPISMSLSGPFTWSVTLNVQIRTARVWLRPLGGSSEKFGLMASALPQRDATELGSWQEVQTAIASTADAAQPFEITACCTLVLVMQYGTSSTITKQKCQLLSGWCHLRFNDITLRVDVEEEQKTSRKDSWLLLAYIAMCVACSLCLIISLVGLYWMRCRRPFAASDSFTADPPCEWL